MTGENNFPVEDTVRECAQLLFVRRGWIWVIGIIVFLYGAAAPPSLAFSAPPQILHLPSLARFPG